MKKSMMMLAVAFAAAMSIMADTETVGGYTWTYRIYDDTAGIYGGTFTPAISPNPTGALTIPSTLGGKPVTSIGDRPFIGCSGLTSVTIPASVTYIWHDAFLDCSGLRSFSVASGNSSYKAVSGLLLTKDGKTLVAAPVGLTGSLTIPDGVTSIDRYAVEYCSGLKSVTIPDSVTNIGFAAFWECSGLKSVTIPNSVMSIEDLAFYGCSGLTSVTIPANVTSIGSLVFGGCDKLKKVTLPMWCKKTNIYYDLDDGYLFTTMTVVGYLSYSWQEYLGLSSKAKITYKDVSGGTSGGSSGGEVAEIWKKAQTFNGAVFRSGKAVGLILLKVGKASKNGEVSVSGTITGLDGKKLTAKGGKVAVNGESATATLTVNGGTKATVTVGKDGISGSWNGATIAMADVGGNWTRTDAKVYVDMDDVPAGTVEELLPAGEPVIPKGGKWSFNKNATVKWVRDRETKEYGLVVDDKNGKTNRSSMKLTYTPKTGIFKGTFKVYALEGPDGKKKLKKYSVNVIGFVVDGKGHGEASCKKPKGGPWTVTVE